MPARPQKENAAQEHANECACNKVRKAARAITRMYDEVLRPSGLRITQFGILGITSGLQPITVSRLADETVTDRTTLARNLKLLEKMGLIDLHTGTDRRERVVVLTKKGREALAKAYPFWKEAQARVMNHLGRGDWESLRDGLSAITSLAHDE